MATNSVLPPFPTFFDTDGAPLDGGYIYVGNAGLEARSRPKASFFDPAATIPTGTATGKGVRTVGGFPSYNGSAAMIYVDGDFSITVTDKNGVLIYSSLNRTLAYGNDVVISPILAPDGNLAATGFGYISEPTTGRIRSSAGVEQDIVLGTLVSQRSLSGSLFALPATFNGAASFAQPATFSTIRTVTNINTILNGEGSVAYTNTATGAESGLGSYTATLTYFGDGTSATQIAHVPGHGMRQRVYASGAWGNWYAMVFAQTMAHFSGVGSITTKSTRNISSIVYNGVGDYTINFSVAMPDLNYGFHIEVASGGTSNTITYSAKMISRTTSSIRIWTLSANTQADFPDITVVTWR